MRTLVLAAALTFACTLAPAAHAGSETPPKGPPWERDILVAQEKALAGNLPIFLYFTKTY